MLVALCLAMVFAISLSSYIALCYTSLVMSTRSVMSARSAELAEAGVEQALYSLNNNDWSLWNASGANNMTATLTMTSSGLVPSSTSPAPLNFGNGSTGTVVVTVTNYQSLNPGIQSQGLMTLPQGSATSGTAVTQVSRTLTFNYLNGPARAPLFVNAVAATSGRVRFRSAGTVDSYTSNPHHLSTFQDYSSLIAGYSAVVTSQYTSLFSASVRLNNAVVKGYAEGFDPYYPGSTNWLSYASAAQLVGSSTPPAVLIDSSRILTTQAPYQPVLPEAPQPPGPSFQTLNPAYWPGGVLSASCSLGQTNPASTTPFYYSCFGINLGGTTTVNIVGPTVIYSSGNVSISGTAGFVLTTQTASLTIVADSGTVTLGGHGITNTNSLSTTLLPPLPKRVAVIGATNPYAVTFSSNQPLPFYGVLYFPQAAIQVTGNPTLCGSIVGASVTFQGSPTIHYDLSLRYPDANLNDAAFTCITAPYTVNSLVSSVP